MTVTSGNTGPAREWWKEAVVYQIYPSSFLDTNGDGWGDIKGITSKLDYLKDLGVDIVWVSPIFKSPQADMGYDIADYKAIDPIYGSLSDVDDLIAELKTRDMKLMMDLVVNHTSDQHAWFLSSRSSKFSPHRDWYIWKPPRGHTPSGDPLPPNNWAQILGEANSAWTYDAPSGEYFLSLFTPEQPDLNWENPSVREAVHDVMHFWLKRGACGYRMDVINLISKDQRFLDAEIVLEGPGHAYQPGFKYFINGPRMHEYLQEINQKVLSHYDAITVGEMPGVTDINEVIRSVGSSSGELNMIFIFDVVDIDNVPGSVRLTLHPWSVRDLRRITNKWQTAMLAHDGWNSVFLENHDNPRSVSRFADDSDAWRTYGAKMLSLMLTTLAGTVYVYQGQELGMRNVPASWDPSEYKDIESINFWEKSRTIASHASSEEESKNVLSNARDILQHKARDHARTPMQWSSSSANSGFCNAGVKPWMRLNDDWKEINAELQTKETSATETTGDATNNHNDKGIDKNNNHAATMSTHAFYRRGLQSRKANREVFIYGTFTLLGKEDAQNPIFAYLRTSSNTTTTPNANERNSNEPRKFLVVLNFSGEDVEWRVPRINDDDDDEVGEKGKVRVRVKKWVAGNYYGEGEIDKALPGERDGGNGDGDGDGVLRMRGWEGLLGICE